MKVKFNKFERIAGIFVLVAVLGSIIGIVFVAIEKKWFESTVEFHSRFEVADGLFPGTEVQMSGIKVGAVTDVTFEEDGQVLVQFYVLKTFANRVKEDSVIRTFRPFIIGDKVLDLAMGKTETAPLVAGSNIRTEKSMDLIEFFGGRRLGPYMETMNSLMENLQILVRAFTETDRTQKLITLFDKMEPLIVNLDKMSQEFVVLSSQMSKKQKMKLVMENLVSVTGEMSGFIKNSPGAMEDMASIVKNLSQITSDLNTILPALTAVAPDLPKASKQAIEALNEAVIVLKAMQKSFLLSGAVKEVREEELKKQKLEEPKTDSRIPAWDNK